MSYPEDPTLLPDIPACPECNSDEVIIIDEGAEKKKKWYQYQCIECGHIWSTEPDPERFTDK